MEENICRLCLNFAKNRFEAIDAVTRQMFQVLSLKVDLEVCTNPILCQDCGDIIKKSYLFKSACTDTEELILSFSAAKETAKIDIRDVYQDSKGVKFATDADFNVCRFCMDQITGHNFVSIDSLIKDVMYVEMLAVFMPKMVINIIKDPVICTSCKENLDHYFKFTQKCLATEKKINKYHQNENICSTSQIKLKDVLGFMFKDTSVARTELSVIKQENIFEDVEQTANEEIKCEALDIKDEDVNSETNASKLEMYKCENCTYETKDKYLLKKHLIIHKDTWEVEMHKCEICTYETKYKPILKRHMLSHKDTSEIVMNKCEICTYETKYKDTLKRHLLSHKDTSEVEILKCSICSYETRYKKYLRKHVLKHKNVPEGEMHKCEICTYESKHKDYVKNHMLSHKDTSEVEMHKCEICTYETKYKNSLKTHMLIHKDASEVEMHKCGLCTHKTKYKYHLKKHMLTHKD